MKIYSEDTFIDETDTQELIEVFSMTNIKEFHLLKSKFLDLFSSTINEFSILAQIGKQNMTFKVNTLNIENEGEESFLNLKFQLQQNFFEPQFEKEEEKKKEKEFNFKPIPIEKAIAFNDKLSNNLHKLENNTETMITKTGGKKNDSTMKALIENGEIKTSKVLEKFDVVVLESIYSIMQKNQFFDIQMLKEEMTQNKNRHKGEIDIAIKKSLDKLSTTKIQIEIPEELQKTFEKNTDFEKIGVKEIILPLREYYVVKGGHKKSVFGLTSNSIYFEYAKAKGQLITKDVKLLQGGIGNATKESIVLVHYISSRILDMKHQKEKNKSGSYIEEIKLQTIWEFILSDNDLKMKKDSLQRKKRRYIEQIKTILENYKKDKEIKDFKEYSEGFQIKI